MLTDCVFPCPCCKQNTQWVKRRQEGSQSLRSSTADDSTCALSWPVVVTNLYSMPWQHSAEQHKEEQSVEVATDGCWLRSFTCSPAVLHLVAFQHRKTLQVEMRNCAVPTAGGACIRAFDFK